MSIECECPRCGARMAFADEKAQTQQHCLSCGQALIIPSESNQTPRIVEPQPDVEKTEPVEGFYRAALVDNWKLFLDAQNITSIVFIIAIVCFNFFLAQTFCCNYVTFIAVWGWLLGFYLNIIYETAFDIDRLPEIYLGTALSFLWYIIKPFLIFFFTLIFTLLPFIITSAICCKSGFIAPEALKNFNDWPILLKFLFFLCLFFFPAAILVTAVAKDFTLLRPDYILTPIIKAFFPYLVTVVLLIIAVLIELNTGQFGGVEEETFLSASGKLAANLAVQLFAIIAMRSIGLFYRHYTCYFKW
jgi:hypothetical protein